MDAEYPPSPVVGPLRLILISTDPLLATLVQSLQRVRARDPRGRPLPDVEVEILESLAAAVARLPKGEVDLVAVDRTMVDPDVITQILAAEEPLRTATLAVLRSLEPPSGELSEEARRTMASDLDATRQLLVSAIDRRAATREMERYAEHILETERKLTSFLEFAGAGVVVVTLAGEVLHANQTACMLLGLSGTTLLGMYLEIPPQPPGETREQTLLVADREIRAELRMLPIDWEGQAARLVFLHDIAPRRSLEQVLEQAVRRNAQLIAALTSLSLGILICDAARDQRTILFANAGYFSLMGAFADDVLDSPFRSQLHLVAEEPPELPRALKEGLTYRTELQLRRQDGTPFWCSLVLNPIFAGDGCLMGLVAVFEDISERWQARSALLDSEARLRALIESTRDVIFSLDAESRLMSCNQAFIDLETALSGVAPLQNQPLTPSFPPEMRERWRAGFLQALSGRSDRIEIEDEMSIDGVVRHYEITFCPIQRAQGDVTGVTTFARDVTARKLAEAKVFHATFHDPLTGLPNRKLLEERLELALKRTARRGTLVGIVLLDVDRFRSYNETLRMSGGDEILRTLAQRLHSCVRPTDTVAREGGDEFWILLEDLRDVSDVLRVAERITTATRPPMHLRGRDYSLTLGMGISIGTGAEEAAELLRDADTALARAKSSGPNRREIFDPLSHRVAAERIATEHALRMAVLRGEFCLHYQPIVELRTGELAGFEALVRWRHPERGMVYPGDFIHLAEDMGLIIELGDWVLREATRQMSDWHRRFPRARPPSISVNLSTRQSERPDLADRIAQSLEDVSLSANHLKLELTESAFVGDIERARMLLEKLASLGSQVQLDDFGTGYSCLRYLHELPCHCLKIDRSFVSLLGPNGERGELVNMILTLAAQLKLAVVAEGVEQASQAAYLLQQECGYGQGYYFSRPMTPEQVERMLASGDLPWNPAAWTAR